MRGQQQRRMQMSRRILNRRTRVESQPVTTTDQPRDDQSERDLTDRERDEAIAHDVDRLTPRRHIP